MKRIKLDSSVGAVMRVHVTNTSNWPGVVLIDHETFRLESLYDNAVQSVDRILLPGLIGGHLIIADPNLRIDISHDEDFL